MKALQKIVVYIIITIFSLFYSQAQTNGFNQSSNHTQTNNQATADKLAEKLEYAASKAPSESIYLKTNKDIYETGEDLWFRAFLLQSKTLTPSLLSNTLYIELEEEKSGKIVWQEKYKRQQDVFAGQVYLADSLQAGNYLLKAYSHASLLADASDFFALRKIKVVKDFMSLAQSKSTPTNSVSNHKLPLQFAVLPEGGQLVYGLQGLLTIKINDALGTPVTVEGTLLEGGQPIASFNTSLQGMASLPIFPKNGNPYQIRFQVQGLDTLIAVPKIDVQGITLNLVSRDSTFLEFVVAQHEDTADQVVYLRGQYRGETKVMAYGLLKKELRFKIPLSEFDQQGIAEFTLFDAASLPRAERLVYVQPNKKLYISLDTSKDQFGLREKCEIAIKVHDELGNPVSTDLALSIYDKFYHSPGIHTSIQDHYGLSAQLRGRIYNPGYYFDEQNENRAEALDLLLLTQGWRKYVWNEANLAAHSTKLTENIVAQKKKTKTLLDPVLISPLADGLSGTIFYTRKSKKAPNDIKYVMAYTLQPDGTLGQNLLLESDTTGKFSIEPADLENRRGFIYLKPFGQEEFGPKLELDNPFKTIANIMKHKHMQYALDRQILQTPQSQQQAPVLDSRALRLQEVEITSKKSTPGFRDKYLGKLDSLYNDKFNSDYVGVPCNTLNCFVHKYGKKKKPVYGEVYKVLLGKDGEILGSDYSERYYYGEKKITYLPAKVKEEELFRHHNLTKTMNYYPYMEFYTPDYENPKEEKPFQDSRNALLWIPSLRTNEKGEAMIKFFTSDIKSGFVIELEGAGVNGLLGYKKINIVVQ